jgi:periplasmic protein TonB
MTFQALLFCPDEKTARVTTQVLTELEFSVDACTEPFAAVKKLMGQHFDAIVVDCDNEQNASLLFKSARNSTSNQASLAVAVVEGQAGVANAFRIGANLVLTKPINVEQAKSTLRVARGLLRKGSEASKASSTPAAPSVPVAAAPAVPKQPERAPNTAATPRPAAPIPAIAAPAVARPSKAQPTTAVARTSDTNREIGSPKTASSAADLFESPQPSTAAQEGSPSQQYPWQPVSKTTGSMAASLQRAAAEAEKVGITPTGDSVARDGGSGKQAPPAFASIAMGTSGAASAPAPAKELPKSQMPSSAFDAEQQMAPTQAPVKAPAKAIEKPAEKIVVKPEVPASIASTSPVPSPTFAALDTQEDSAAGKGSKVGVLLAVAAVILAVLGYFGYTKFVSSKQSTAAPAATSSAAPALPAGPTTEPTTTASATVTASAPSGAANSPQPSAKNTTPAAKEETSEESDVTVTHPGPKLIVKSGLGERSAHKAEATADVAAPTLGVNEDQSAIPSIVQSTPVAVPKVAAPQQTLRVSQGVTQGLLTRRVQPVYPPQAMQMHIQGAVQVLATISKEGRITTVKILNGDPILSRAAADAVSQWRYKPYFLNGEPVEIQTQIVVNFKLP